MDLEKISQRIKKLKKERQCGAQAVNPIETGKKLEIEDIIRLADIFDVSVDYLLGLTDLRYRINPILQEKIRKNQPQIYGDFFCMDMECPKRIGVFDNIKNVRAGSRIKKIRLKDKKQCET